MRYFYELQPWLDEKYELRGPFREFARERENLLSIIEHRLLFERIDEILLERFRTCLNTAAKTDCSIRHVEFLLLDGVTANTIIEKHDLWYSLS